MAYFDPQNNTFKPQLYDWDSLVLETWDSAITWEDYTGSYTSSAGVPDLVYTTEIIDNQRLAWVNPLCEVQSSGTHVIKVYAAESIDSSSLLPGDPVIDTSDSTTRIPGVYGRYFQFRVEVFDGADSYISQVRTDISTQEQIESITGDSATHPGTTAMRYAPITKEYSVLTSVTGLAKASTGVIPFLTVGSLTDPTQPRYNVYNITSTDSSTLQASVGDFTGNKTVTNVGATIETGFGQYKWAPYGILTDSNKYFEFDGLGVTGTGGQGDFCLEGWIKVDTDADYFLKLEDSAYDYRLRTVGESTGTIILQYSKDGGANWAGSLSASSTDYVHWQIQKNSNTIFLTFDGATQNGGYTANNPWDMDNMTISIGCFGTGLVYHDDIQYSDGVRSTTTPTAEFIADANTLCLINGNTTAVVITSGTQLSLTDAEVTLHITGLPKMVVNAQGNIVEQ